MAGCVEEYAYWKVGYYIYIYIYRFNRYVYLISIKLCLGPGIIPICLLLGFRFRYCKSIIFTV